jgi:hypothetical protein
MGPRRVISRRPERSRPKHGWEQSRDFLSSLSERAGSGIDFAKGLGLLANGLPHSREDVAHLGRLQLENKVPSGSALAGWAVWERALEISPRCPTALRACLDTDLRK